LTTLVLDGDRYILAEPAAFTSRTAVSIGIARIKMAAISRLVFVRYFIFGIPINNAVL
jgi:hypothetical protein